LTKRSLDAVLVGKECVPGRHACDVGNEPVSALGRGFCGVTGRAFARGNHAEGDGRKPPNTNRKL